MKIFAEFVDGFEMLFGCLSFKFDLLDLRRFKFVNK
jgi:hypothetical protein